MPGVEDRTEQGNLSPQKPRRKQSALGKTTVLVVLGSALTSLFQFFFVWLVGGTLLLPVVGMMVVASVVATSPPGASTNTTTNGMPTVHMAGSNFLTNVVLVPRGSKLVFVDDDSNEHLIRNGSWIASGTPQPRVEPGAPV